MANSCVTSCIFCEKEFKTRNALRKHVDLKHPGCTTADNIKFKWNGKDVSYPKAKRISKTLKRKYLTWIGELTESINSAHNPLVPGKWYHLEASNVPQEYFSQLLYDINSAYINSARVVKHLKPPLWRTDVLRLSYKTNCEDDVLRAFSQNTDISLVLSKSFSGSNEIEERAELFGRAALEAAKSNESRLSATTKSKINIGNGDGRATREMELIWFPLYHNSSSGHLKIRLHIGKVKLY
ncbi:uncharacterized protein LOC110253365 [Exaiptasia diaphana]|uniref:C2H2-type domain-containing protein n=1 Tax=Exaiptasia diaphana TaxID=2652724 RepID=A0A913Y6H7_EXADI|nr:uncharacterized protein LOC110253365 [Exaiptasia diaphana]